MSYEQKEGTGALFKNDRKSNPAQPDYQGDCLINGVPMRIAGWLKDGKKGKFMSLSIQPKGDAPPKSEPRASGGSIRDMESDIPF